jgi:hypothetical protein
MNEKIRQLKYLIKEYEELCDEAEEMSHNWESGSPELAAMSDPSDQYMISLSIENKYNEIKNILEQL